MRFTLFKTIFFGSLLGLVTATPARSQQNGLASLEGTVVDADTQQPVAGAIISVETIVDVPVQQRQRIGPTGVFRFILDPNKNYYIRTEAVGYRYTQEKLIFTSAYATRLYGKIILLRKGGPLLPPELPILARSPAVTSPVAAPPTQSKPAGTSLTPAATAPSAPVTATAPATPVATPTPPVTIQTVQTQLKAVQFVQSKAELLPESQPALDQLLAFLRENPGITIELAGHTDNQGGFDENLALSKQRVDTVKAFLVRSGISTSRISSRGYGSTRPIASNNSEATRRLNRRVEMTILTK